MKNESISLVLPVYNAAPYLKDCMQSLLTQTRLPNEIILIDDGSIDDSGELCDQFQQQYPDIVCVRHQMNQGVSAARNEGLALVHSEYVAFVDPDDWLESEMLQEMLDAIRQTEANAAFCGFVERFCDVKKQDILHEPACSGVVTGTEALYQCLNGVGNGYFSAVWGKIFHTESLKQSDGTFLKMKPYAIAEDELWLTQLVPALEKVVLLPKPFYNWRQREGSALHNRKSFSQKWYAALDAKREAAALLEQVPAFSDLCDAKIYADLFHVFWQSWCYGTQQDYQYFRTELAPYKKAFYRSREFSTARKLKASVMDIMIFLHLPKSWMEMLGESTLLELKRKFRRG